MMIQHIPCKQAPVCHVAVESHLNFSSASVLLHCIDTVMTKVVGSRPFRLIHSEHVFAYITEMLRGAIG